jgi:hypothetical protein
MKTRHYSGTGVRESKTAGRPGGYAYQKYLRKGNKVFRNCWTMAAALFFLPF